MQQRGIDHVEIVRRRLKAGGHKSGARLLDRACVRTHDDGGGAIPRSTRRRVEYHVIERVAILCPRNECRWSQSDEHVALPAEVDGGWRRAPEPHERVRRRKSVSGVAKAHIAQRWVLDAVSLSHFVDERAQAVGEARPVHMYRKIS